MENDDIAAFIEQLREYIASGRIGEIFTLDAERGARSLVEHWDAELVTIG